MEIPLEQKTDIQTFSYEGLFKLGENFGAVAGAILCAAIGLIILFIPFISLFFYFYYVIIGYWIIKARCTMISNLFGLKRSIQNSLFSSIAVLNILALIAGGCATALIMLDIIIMTPNWYYFTDFAFISSLNLYDIQLGVVLGIMGVAFELASNYLISYRIISPAQEKCFISAKKSFYFDVIAFIISCFILITALFSDLQPLPVLFALVCIMGFFSSNSMSNAFKIYYYRKMDERAKIEFNDMEHILAVRNLKTWFPIRGGSFFSRIIGNVKAVDGVSFDVKRGETLALVGESGCGKTTLGRTLLGLVKRKEGEVFFNGKAIPVKFPPYLRRRIQFIFQDPDASLNPRMNILQIISEPIRNLNLEMNKNDIQMRVLELMNLVSMKYEHLFRFPHEFSGGQKQRIVIARALACNPDFVILDEPTSALDVSVQAQILNLLKELQQKLNLSYLFITHNLSVVHHIASRVAVMYLGKLVEIGPVDEIFDNPRHPYTRALLSARSIPDPEKARHRIILQGDVPSPINPPSGCPFNPRCFYDMKSPLCKIEPLKKIEVGPDHFIWSSMEDENACWRDFTNETIDIPTDVDNIPDTEL